MVWWSFGQIFHCYIKILLCDGDLEDRVVIGVSGVVTMVRFRVVCSFGQIFSGILKSSSVRDGKRWLRIAIAMAIAMAKQSLVRASLNNKRRNMLKIVLVCLQVSKNHLF